MPVRATLCGLPLALSVTSSDAASLPAVLGVKVTVMVAVAAGAIEIGRVPVVRAKSLALAPERPKAEMTSVALPVFVNVTVSGALVVPFS